jgi:hypothetical protein
LVNRGTHRRVSEPTWFTEEHTREYLSLPSVQRNTVERAYLAYRGTHRRVSEPTWFTEEHTMEYIIGAYLAYRGTHRRVSEPTWLKEEHTGEYLSLPGLQRNTQEST